MTKQYTFLIALCIFCHSAFSQNADYRNSSLSFETRAWDLLSKMTLEQKISQLGNDAPSISALGIEKYDWWNECLHGVARAGEATVFPQAIGMAASFDTACMYKVADAISTEARAKYNEAVRRNQNGKRYYGLTFWSPNINIFRDPRWGRGHETYGEDPYLTAQMGVQFVRGLQGNDLKYFKVIATAKHYAVHSGPESERHFFNAEPPMRDLYETYLPAFESLVKKSGVFSVMSAYNRVYGQSASASKLLLENILRNEWGFKGYVVSDCGAIRDIYKFHKVTENRTQASALGITNGCDLECGTVYQSALKMAVKKNLVSEQDIDTSVYRLMYARMKLGMFDNAEDVPFSSIPFSANNSTEHDVLAFEMAKKSMVLLKNNGILPLNKNAIKKIVVLGPNANSLAVLRSNYFGEASHPVTVLEGIKKLAGNAVEIFYANEVPIASANSKKFKFSSATLQKIKAADVVLFVGGLDATWEGEEGSVMKAVSGFSGGDRTKIELPDIQLQALQEIKQSGKPVVFVLMSGSAVSFNGMEKNMDAILQAWYPGQRGGDAVADILFGNYNPAGRLPVTFYSSTNELGDFRNYNLRSGKGLTYRFYKGNALYPFGHGLSYTQFEYSSLEIDKTTFSNTDTIRVSVTIKNIGKADGEEVVQLYIKDLDSKLWMPEKQLKGFQKVYLKKDEASKLTFQITIADALRYYDENSKQFKVEPSEFQIQIGASSQDIRLQGNVKVR